MEELLELQRQLAQLQETTTSNRLSERLIVDLVDKLIKEYDLKLFFSQDGQSYVTPNYLAQAIFQEIMVRGRLQIGSLVETLGVSYDKLEYVIEKNTWNEVLRVQDELMSLNYIQQINDEIEEELELRQQMAVSEIASKYGLPIKFVKTNLLQGTINGDLLRTEGYLEILKARIRGVLRGAIKPLSLIWMCKTYDIDEEMVHSMVDELLKDETLDGKIAQGQFIPSIFLKNQEKITRKFFTQNNYVEYDMLAQQLNIQKPKEYLKTQFKNEVILLDGCGFSRQALPSLKDQIENLISCEGYTDLQVILPPSISENDIQTLLFKEMNIENAEYKNMLIFSQAHLTNLANSFKPKIVQIIYDSPQKMNQQNKQPEDDNIQASAGGFSKKKPKKPQQQQKQTELFNENQALKHLVDSKLIEHDDAVPELYQLLQPYISKVYEQVKSDLFEKKKSGTSEMIQELQRRVEDSLLGILMSCKSISQIQNNYSEIDIRVLVENTLYAFKLFIENLVILLTRKYQIDIAANLSDQVLSSIECGMAKLDQVFKSSEGLVQSIECLNKEQQKILKEMVGLLQAKKLNELEKYLLENMDKLNIKTVLEKKSEKGLIQYIKYANRDAIKSLKGDLEGQYQKALVSMVSDALGLYFVGNHDRLMKVLSQLLYEWAGQSDLKKYDGKLVQSLVQNIMQCIEKANWIECEKNLNDLIKTMK